MHFVHFNLQNHVVTDFGEWLNEVMLKIGVTLFAMLYVTPFS